MIDFIVRIFGLFLCFYGVSERTMPLEMASALRMSFGGRQQFLTIIGLNATILTLIFGLVIRYARLDKNGNIFKYVSSFHTFLLSLIIPVEMTITILFWVLYLKDPTLLISKEFYERNIKIRLFSNLCMHLFPFILLIIEIIDTNIKRSNIHLIAIIIFSITYYFWVSFIASMNKRWPYPLLDGLNGIGRLLIFTAVTLLTVSFYETIMYLAGKTKKLKRE
ncbi:FAR-17a/AIG1-like protein [Hamiltosporidium tvaerminnensis]|uniref:FAR-17a/AIG1-like protein n=1 Tax=Hamiltosporidium tvaerminnensis TaxID=1176355 RepID=A0A4Q9LPN4_9MICR|nr:hypothetical protein LUQ84_3602 [Hamiltosporidium tvaerminnensis]TBU03371.1 FAR-17a/AIG1-like protein [Hamiltosporidium tvaerminnensis]TBU10443.1 FAR-17a/AIG1-like protein [Hamiltosporidium tvaerminnensis]